MCYNGPYHVRVVRAVMVIATAAQAPLATRGSIRPMDPAHDLGNIADLIASAFAGELDDRGQAALREMRWLSRLWPFVWWWAQADPAFHEAFNGFVWEETGPGEQKAQILGNVSLNRAPGNRQRWIICNVVVEEERRGQGIGRRLTETAISEARDIGAAGVVLQVHQDNSPAYQLYTNLGFQPVTGETELQLDTVHNVARLSAPGYGFRPWRAADGTAALELAQTVTPDCEQWLRPIRADQYKRDWWTRSWQWFTGLLATKRTYHLVAVQEERLAALMTVTASFGSDDHQLRVLIHPDHRGMVEGALISHALHLLAAATPKPVRATVNQDAGSTMQALRTYGFQELRTLLTLSKDFV
jgi:ribosomal protein S18 acetylase RimI-like enzyme